MGQSFPENCLRGIRSPKHVKGEFVTVKAVEPDKRTTREKRVCGGIRQLGGR